MVRWVKHIKTIVARILGVCYCKPGGFDGSGKTEFAAFAVYFAWIGALVSSLPTWGEMPLGEELGGFGAVCLVGVVGPISFCHGGF